MQKKYERASLIVTAEQYELDKGLEDGFELYTKVITNGWISTDGLFKVCRMSVYPKQAGRYFYPRRRLYHHRKRP